jgi:hypothetical protein
LNEKATFVVILGEGPLLRGKLIESAGIDYLAQAGSSRVDEGE